MTAKFFWYNKEGVLEEVRLYPRKICKKCNFVYFSKSMLIRLFNTFNIETIEDAKRVFCESGGIELSEGSTYYLFVMKKLGCWVRNIA